MKRFVHPVLWLLFTVTCIHTYAQDDPQFTQYMFNQLQFNPATAGNEQAIVSTVDARSQWVSIPGAPQSQSFTSHFPIYKISSGGGISILNDVTGQQRTTAASLSYAYQKQFKKSTLSFGLYGGIVQRSLDGSKLISPTGSYDDVIIDHNDDNIPVSLQNDIIPDAGAGVYYYGKKFYAGISANHLLNNYFNFETPGGTASMQYSPNAFVTAGYKIVIGDKFGIMPNVLYKTDLIESMVDVNTIFDYKNNILFGASFRSYLNEQTDAVALIGGWNISEKFGISYSYDITLSDLKTVSEGSHEIVLKYKIFVDKPKVGKEINNLRYLYY